VITRYENIPRINTAIELIERIILELIVLSIIDSPCVIFYNNKDGNSSGMGVTIQFSEVKCSS
jgi:hypothetical protein